MQPLPLHTHAEVKGVSGVRLLKAVTPAEMESGWPPAEWRLVQARDGLWVGGEGDAIEIANLKDPLVVAPGDVVRLREGSTLISNVWRRGARSNSLFATERCNSRCLMCSQPPRDEDDSWRVSELLATIPLIDKDERQLGVTGGEPTLLGSGLTQVLAACGRELPDTQLHVLTNGRAFSEAAAAAEWVGAGGARTTWAVPLYSDDAYIHDEVVAAEGAFEETLNGLVELATFGARVEIRVVLHRLTVPTLQQLAVFLYRRLPFVEHVALMGLEPMGFAKANRERLWTDPVDYAETLGQAVFYLANRGMQVSIYNTPLCVLPRSLWPFARRSISEWKNNYAPGCEPCVLRDHCAGFFTSAGPAWRSRAIQARSYEEVSHEVA
jgi:His-Xaa-Ser system radical SAM maturase HxsC